MTSNSSTISPTTTGGDDDYKIERTEWIIIVVILVFMLLVFIITVAKCFEIRTSSGDKALLQNDFQSVRSGGTTIQSVASTSKKMKKMPLNAEITRFSAGRQSRSAEYGVVIKDIGKSVQNETMSSWTSPTPPHFLHASNTLAQEPRYAQRPQVMNQQNGTLSSPPNAAMIVDREYATTGRPKPDSKAVFVASDEPMYSGMATRFTGGQMNTLTSQAGVPLRLHNIGNTYQIAQQRPMHAQPVLLMQ